MESIISAIAIGILSILGYSLYLKKSCKISPIIAAGKDSVIFRIQDKAVQKNFLGLKVQVQITDMEIKLIGGDGSIRTFHVSRNLPTEPITLWPGIPYSYKFRNKENFLFSSWSEPQPLKRQGLPYSVPARISSRYIANIRQTIMDAQSCKILLLGRIGQGKSSFLNTLFTAFNAAWTAPAISLPDNESVTHELTVYEFITDRLKICDMPGWERGYNFPLLGNILRGELDQVTISNMNNQEIPRLNAANAYDRRVNVAIVVIGVDDSGEFHEVDRELFRRLRASHIPFLTVLTKVDRLARPNEKEITTQNFYEDPRVTTRCNVLQSVYSEQVLPVINYRQYTDQNDIHIDYFALQTLNIALRMAR